MSDGAVHAGTTATETEPGCAHVDPRVTRSRQRVLASAVRLLREHGAAGLTVEGVAAHSGVAKTTIYRHFADRDAIHIAAAEALGEPIELTSTDDVVADVRNALRVLAGRLRNGDFAAVLTTCVDAAERSERMAELTVASCQSRRGWLLRRLQVAVEHDELTGPPDLDLLVSQLSGVMFFRRLISRQPIGDDVVDAVVDTVLVPLVHRRTEPSSRR